MYLFVVVVSFFHIKYLLIYIYLFEKNPKTIHSLTNGEKVKEKRRRNEQYFTKKRQKKKNKNQKRSKISCLSFCFRMCIEYMYVCVYVLVFVFILYMNFNCLLYAAIHFGSGMPCPIVSFPLLHTHMHTGVCPRFLYKRYSFFLFQFLRHKVAFVLKISNSEKNY